MDDNAIDRYHMEPRQYLVSLVAILEEYLSQDAEESPPYLVKNGLTIIL
jgi:hypothetical protein